jgi:rubrerythrin
MPVSRGVVVARRAILFIPIMLACVLAARAPVAAAQTPKTLDNLLAAYNGESNAHAKYVEFAKKADQEGFAGAAALFRAAAQAEDTHAANHAVVIKKLGGTPKADIKLPPIGTTAANLKTAIEGESYERDTMYPGFIKEAQATGNKDALRTFRMAVSAETEHAKLYTQASADLGAWKSGKTFYVCPVCGKTITVIDFDKCPVCFTEKGKFKTVV